MGEDIFSNWGLWVLIVSIVGTVIVVGMIWYIYFGQYLTEYKKGKIEIFAFVKSYKLRCTGNNRFVVTVESLQDSFREYEIRTIEKVWLELVKERVIEMDPQDNVWCVR